MQSEEDSLECREENLEIPQKNNSLWTIFQINKSVGTQFLAYNDADYANNAGT